MSTTNGVGKVSGAAEDLAVAAVKAGKGSEAIAEARALGKRPGTLAASPVLLDDVERITVKGGVVAQNRTTGAITFEQDDGERVVVRPADAKPEPPAPVSVPGRMMIEGGKTTFIPDDDSESLDLSPAVQARDAERALTKAQRAERDFRKTIEAEQKRIGALATDAEKITAMEAQGQQLVQRIQVMSVIEERLRQTILGQALLLAGAQTESR